MSDPITREEKYLASLAEGTVPDLTPITRKEMFLAAAAGMDVTPPEPITREEMLISKIQSGGGGGDDDLTKSIIERTITEYNDANVTSIGDYGLAGCKALTSVHVKNAKSIGANAFSSCTSLETVFAENAEEIGTSAFAWNEYKLKTVIIPSAITIGNSAFEGSAITSLDLPVAKKLIGKAVYRCGALKNISAPMLTEVGTFEGCGNLESICLPELSGSLGYTFVNCKSLRYADFSKVSGIGAATFNTCTALNVLILRNETVCPLTNVNAFSGSPFASGGTGGTVYCPSALITQYQQATNWSTLYAAGTCNFVAIEGSEYE